MRKMRFNLALAVFICVFCALVSFGCAKNKQGPVDPAEPERYTVTYRYNYSGAPNDGVYDTQTVDKDGTATRPATDPTRSGFDFIGWYSDYFCLHEYDFSTPVTANKDIYAGWEEQDVDPQEYTVTYRYNYSGAPNGGVYDTQTVDKDGIATRPATDPTRSGFDFIGWYADAACATEYNFATPVTANKDIYAGWEEQGVDPQEYTVTYRYNYSGAPNGGVYNTQTVDKDGTATRPATDPTRSGFDFIGWYVDAACATEYNFSTPITANKDIYAGWEEIPVLVGITVSGPTKTEYVVGQAFNPAGLVVKAVYSVGEDVVLSSSQYAYTAPDTNVVGTKTVTVSYMGNTADFTVTVVAKAISSFAVSGTLTNASQYVGETLSTAGLTFTATYNDASTETVTQGIVFESAYLDEDNKFIKHGTATITASYGGKTAPQHIAVNVVEHVVTEFAVGGTLDKGSYEKDELFDPTGLTFTATYDDGSTKAIAASEVTFTSDKLSGMKLVSYGVAEITASFKGVDAPTKISVSVNAPDTLEVGAWYLLGTFNDWGADDTTAQYKLTVSTQGTGTAKIDSYVITNVKFVKDDQFKIAKYSGKEGVANTFTDYKNNNAVSVDPSKAVLGAELVDSGDDFGNIVINDIDASVASSGWNLTITEYYDNTPHWVDVNIKLDHIDWRDPIDGSHSDGVASSDPKAGDIDLRGNFTNNFNSSDAWSSRNDEIVEKIGDSYYFQNVYLKAHDNFKVVKVSAAGEEWLGMSGSFALGEMIELSSVDGSNANIYLGAIADGRYNIVIDAKNNTLAVYAADDLTVSLKAGVTIKAGATPTKADLTVSYGGEAVDDYTLIAEQAAQGGNSLTVIYNGAVRHLLYTAVGEYSVAFHKNTVYSVVGMPLDLPAVAEGSLITEPTAPALKGFTFGGWFVDDALAIEWDFAVDKVMSAVNLYAKWTAEVYTVEYSVPSGATTGDDPVTYTAVNGAFEDIALSPASKAYYTFDGWYTALQGGDKVTALGYDLIPNSGSVITLYARFVPFVYVIEYMFLNDGYVAGFIDGYTAPTSFTYDGAAVALPAVGDIALSTNAYSFSGWYLLGDDGKTAVSAIDTLFVTGKEFDDNKIVLVANFAEKEVHEITFNYNYAGAPTSGKVSVIDGEKLIAPQAPKRVGYAFGGWYNDAACTDEYDFDTAVTAADELFAKWDIVDYTVEYIGDDNASSQNPVSFNIGSADFTLNDAVTATVGYYFVGWYTAAVGGEKVTKLSSDMIDGNTVSIKLYARFDNTYAVTFDDGVEDGAIVSDMPEDITAAYGSLLGIPTVTPKREGYVFLQWEMDGKEWDFATDTVKGDMTLTATWTENVVTGLTVNSAPDKVNYFAGDALVLDGLNITLTYTDGTTVAAIGDDVLEYVTLTGVPTVGNTSRPLGALSVDITVTAIDTTVSTTFGVEVYNKATELEVTTAPDKTRYEDESETLVLSGMIVTVYFNNGKDLHTTVNSYTTNPQDGEPIGNITQLIVSYTRTMTADGLENQQLRTSTPIEVKAKQVASITVKTAPTKTVYSVGDKVDLSGLVLTVTYDVGEPSDVAYSEINAANFSVKYNNGGDALVDGETSYTVVYGGKEAEIAIPRPSIFTVSFDGNVLYDTDNAVDAESMPRTQTVAVYNKQLTVADPLRGEHDEYVFGGWYTDSACTEQWGVTDGGSTVGNVTRSMTLYAKWIAQANGGDNVAVTYNNIDALGGSAVKYYAVDSEIALEEPSAIDYAFVGWYTDEACTTAFDTEKYTVWQEHTVLYGKWECTYVAVSVTFDANGGLIGDKDSVVIELRSGTAIGEKKVADPARAGYKFVGWFVGDVEYTDFDADVTEDLVLTAKWVQVFTVAFAWNYESAPDDGVIATQSVVDGGYAVRPATDPVRDAEKFTFNGWFVDAAGKTEFKFETTKITKDTTVYAKWTALSQGIMVVNDAEEKRMLDNTEHMSAEEKSKYDLNYAFFGENSVTFATGDKLKFKVENVVVNLTLDTYSTNVKLVDGSDNELEVISGGEFVLYLKHNKTTKAWEIYVSGGEPIADDKGRVDCESDKAYIVGQFEGDKTFVSEKGFVMEYDAGGNFGNGEWVLELELKEGEIIKFRCGSVWAGFEQIEGSATAKANFESIGTDKNIKVKIGCGGKYKFIFKPVNVANRIWIEKSDGEVDPPVTDKNAYYKIGADGEAVLIGAPEELSDQDKKDGVEIKYTAKDVAFAANDKVYFTIGEDALDFIVDSASTGVIKPAAATGYLEISKDGVFGIYFKKFKDSEQWHVYATRAIDPSEITKPADTVEANGAYLVGAIEGSDASWDNSETKGFALTKQADGELYELTIELTAGDNFKFYKTGATTATKTWVGYVATENIDAFMTSGSDSLNIVVKATGKFRFLVDFAKKTVYVSYSADGEPDAPEVPSAQDVVYLRGSYNGTEDWAKGWKMESVALTDGAVEKYRIEVTVEAGKSLVFKVVYDGEWINAVHGACPVTPQWEGDNLKLTEGSYVISLLVWNVEKSDWKIYIENKE